VQFVLTGLALGLGAGLAPGPLMALVVTTVLASGFRAGARVAFSPLLTDVVVITVSVLVVGALPDRATAALGVAGGLYVVWLGIEALRERPVAVEDPVPGSDRRTGPDPLRRGALLNLLSPHPWVFWLSVGGPLLVAAWSSSALAAVGFLLAFYLLLIGSKVALAAAVAGGRRYLSERGLRIAHIVAGALLLLTGVVLVVQFAPALLA
jgi:threonine/homoserine/homoserine lactone efflux protein